MISPAVWLHSWLNVGLVVGSCLIVVFVVVLCICCIPRRDFSQSGVGVHLFKKHSRSLVAEKNKNYKSNDLLGNFDSKVEESIECKEIKSSNKTYSDLDSYDDYKGDAGVYLSNESLSSFYSAYPLTISKSTSRESFVSMLSV
ncbi:unnamed protein product [Phyllotreta striolata]|uniref:Uncharacterized protein n=1 Tax=Phyllotreta striolata TaxID=444603 RepID=A0A9N9XVE8_PHYSR|nr:unnamed protein product [Phyllotreta striolata]